MVDKLISTTNTGKPALDDALAELLPQLRSAKTLYLALSGGLDSTVLFHLLLASDVAFTALHFNHSLSSNANEWQAFCDRLCAQYQRECISLKGKVENSGQGLEEAARAARYDFFMQHLKKGDILLTAHHANDQAETLLLRLLRGSGLRGLAAMPRERVMGFAKLLRPLLNYQRQELQTYAESKRLSWVEDESNQNSAFSRNYLRQEIFPRLQARWPNNVEQLSACSELLASEANLLREYSAEDLHRCNPKAARLGESLALNILKGFSEARQAAIFREWFRQESYRPFSRQQFQQLLSLVHAADDAQPLVETRDWQIRRFDGRVYLLPQTSFLKTGKLNTEKAPGLTPTHLHWNSESDLDLGDAVLRCISGPKVEFTIAFRRGGERCQPVERNHSTTLKHALQEFKLEPWWRDRIPLIFYRDELCAVGDLFVCKAGEAWRFKWDLTPPNTL